MTTRVQPLPGVGELETGMPATPGPAGARGRPGDRLASAARRVGTQNLTALLGYAVAALSLAKLGLERPSPTLALPITLVGIAAAESLAVRRRDGSVLTFTFPFLVAVALLEGWAWLPLLGIFSVVLGDGVLRRQPLARVRQRAALLTLMLGPAGLVTDAADARLDLAVMSITMPLWIALLVLALGGLRFERGAATVGGLTAAMGAGAYLLALWTAPLWRSAASTELVLALSALAFAGLAMTVDAFTTTVVALRSAGRAGLELWRGVLLTTLYRYNALAIVGFFLAWGYLTLGPGGYLPLAGLVVGAAFCYRTMVRLEDQLFGTVCALTSALDARDPYTSGHSDRVAAYALATGRELGLSRRRLRLLQLAGQLHDFGKVGVPDRVLLKPGKLTAEEFGEMQHHAEIGRDIVRNVPGLRDVSVIVGQDHERWNGTGYPLGLSGHDIGLEARILAVCDVYDAMTTDRPYRRGLASADVIGHLESKAGMEFDPAVVDAFVHAQRGGRLSAVLEWAYCLTH